MSVTLLSGGTGGAKLARGLYDLLGDELSVIANTGDDIEVYGAYVSPDPDLITFWLADRIDEQGWGIAGDSYNAMAMLRELGNEITFALGDRDLAVCIERRRLLDGGSSLSDAQAVLTRAFGVSAAVIPMSDQAVRTRIVSGGRSLPLQEFLIVYAARAPIDDVHFAGAPGADGAPAALAALAHADAIIIGPSNPIISIGPMLAIDSIRTTLEAATVPVVAVSPIVGGAVLKGPTAACLAWAGQSADADGVARYYGALIDAIIADEPVAGVRSLTCDVSMPTAGARRELARRTLELADTLRR